MPIPGKSILCAALLAVSAPAVQSAALAEPQPGAAAVVEAFDNDLLDAMRKGGGLGPKVRYERLAPVMTQAFDMAEMAEKEASPHWAHLTADQKTRLVAAYAAFEAAQYAEWFDAYVGQNFRIGEIRTLPDGVVEVSTVMSGGGVPALPLEYRLRAGRDGGWRIVDVRYAGWLSVVERRHAEFLNLLDHAGAEILIARLDTKRQEALAHADNPAAPHLLQRRTDQWSLPVYPLN
jgi:hopanoid biosynthesis associated membrane protein HpnM